MGTKFAPAYAILTLGFIEETILYPSILQRWGEQVQHYFKANFWKYIDDCFII